MSVRWEDINAIYQIYPRSFRDSNGDGTGDLQGIIEKLDYIKGQRHSLGIDAIWLSPFYPSPMADFGYDVSDYYDVDPLFGSMKDFKKLVHEAHDRDIKVMVDFVPNHTSSQHEWFVDSRSSRTNEKRDWYIWRDPKPDGSPPNNWLSVFGGSAWEYDQETEQYYLHSFLSQQPDLNWDNPEVQRAMKNVLRFWMEHGVDGIRADAVWVMGKDTLLRDNPMNPAYVEGMHDPYHSILHTNDTYGDKLFIYLKEMADTVAEYADRIILFEDYLGAQEDWADIKSRFYLVNPEVAAPFSFEGIIAPYSANVYREFVNRYENEIGNHLRPFYCFGNHDNSRLRSRLGDQQARLVALIQLTLPGIPVIYYGDELGMTDGTILPQQIKDPFELRVPGMGLGRDPARTPMQWSDEPHAGFSTVDPWLPVARNYHSVNVEAEQGNEHSYFNLYRSLLKIRDRPIFRVGTVTEWQGSDEHIYGFFRKYRNETMFVLCNMSDEEKIIDFEEKGDIIISTHPIEKRRLHGKIHLAPHQGVVVQHFLVKKTD